MRTDNIDMTKLRRAVTIAAAIGVVVLVAVFAARCSEPSTVVKGGEVGAVSIEDVAAPTNAAAAAQNALDAWAAHRVTVVSLRWLDSDTAVVSAALDDGEHVAVTVVNTRAGWQAPWPPTPISATKPVEVGVFEDVPQGADADERWQTAMGFLEAWLAGDDTWRWAAAGFDPDPPSVAYSSWAVTGAGQPVPVPGAMIAVLPIDVEASANGGPARQYRFWVAVAADSDGQIGVTALANRPPPQAQAQ